MAFEKQFGSEMARSMEKKLFKAILAGEEEIVKLLVNGDDMGTSALDSNTKDENGFTALYVTALSPRDSAGIAKILIDAGARVDYCDGILQRTVLHCAVENANPGVVKVLCEAGADTNAKDENGKVPLDMIILNEEEIVPLLMQHGAVDPKGVAAKILRTYA